MTVARAVLGSFLVLAAATETTFGQATFINLTQADSANDMTPDGRIVVGRLSTGGAYSWTAEDGYKPIGGYEAVAVSDDGSVSTPA